MSPTPLDRLQAASAALAAKRRSTLRWADLSEAITLNGKYLPYRSW